MTDAKPITLLDFRRQLREIIEPGWFMRCLEWTTGWFGPNMKSLREDPEVQMEFARMSGIIDAMTPEERMSPEFIDRSRKSRIAKGAGVRPADVAQLIYMYETSVEMNQKLASGELPTKRWPF